MFSQYDDSIKKMQNRIYYLWIALCLSANLIGTMFNYFARGFELITKICAGIGFAMVIVIILSHISGKKTIASVVIFLMLTWIEFPVLFMFYKDVVIAYFILSIFAGPIVFSRKVYYFFSLTSIAWYMAVIWYGLRNDDFVTLVYDEMTFFIVAFAAAIIQIGILFYYEKQKKKLSEANEAIEYSAKHDSLTGLYNRGYLMQDLSDRMSEQKKFMLAMIDIDNFKKINDTYGHQAGDAVLKTLGQNITNLLKGESYSARYGGEEIVLVFMDMDEAACRNTLSDLRESVNSFSYGNDNITVTFSGGISFSGDFTSLNEIIKNVDDKLYEAKKTGKDKVL